MAKTYNDYPASASANARKVLDWKKKYGKEVKGMTVVGWVRANQLANRESLSYSTIARMAAFNRHRQNSEIAPEYKDTPWKDRGYVAWLGWGGTSGINWAIKKAESIRNEKMEDHYPDGEVNHPDNENYEIVSFDYDGTFSTKYGFDKAKEFIDSGVTVYIISARSSKEGMIARASKLGIPSNHIYATGSNSEKIKKVNELNVSVHYDNNKDVVDQLGNKGKLI